MSILKRYAIGKDFTEQDFQAWREKLTWWIGDRFANIKSPSEHADKVLKAALNGTKLDGDTWINIPHDFFKRIILMCGFDLAKGIGVRDPYKARARRQITKDSGEKTTDLPPMDLTKAMETRIEYIQDLLTKYPHLDNPVYKPKVEELAETIVKSRMISTDFLTSKGRELELLSKIRESLHNQIGQLMKFLEIAPEQRVRKHLEIKNSDVGSLVAKLTSYGEQWEEYERIDALRELIQKYRMLNSVRPDGTPQLNDWELWHMTRTRPIVFTCRHGETYTLLDGFTPEEIEQALIQAQKVYGFGIEAIGSSDTTTIDIALAEEGFTTDIPLSSPDIEDNETTS